MLRAGGRNVRPGRAALAIAAMLATAATSTGSETPDYPIDLLLGGKSATQADGPSPALPAGAQGPESSELRHLRELEMELFPPDKGGKCTDEPLFLGTGFTVHGGKASSSTAVIDAIFGSGAIPGVAAGGEPPVPLLGGDLDWLEGLVMPDLPVRWDDRVIVYLDRFRSDGKWRKIVRAWLARSEKYGPVIRATLRDRGLPEDLQYLAMIESGYDPKAVSWAGAVGLWQFMPTTGEEYGLPMSKWADQRKNPELSTAAAAAYLSDLEDRLGSWHLAMAAYNMGYGGLTASMQKYNTNDYWQLAGYEAGLPWSTANYVPKILAAAIVGRNREAFGMGDVKYEPPVEYDVAIVQLSAKLSQIAKAAGVDEKAVAALNPEIVKGRVPPDMLPYPVRIPKGSGKSFEKSWPDVAAGLKPLKSYTVKFGDTLARIAQAHGTGVKQLAEVNDIKKKDLLSAGETILVPAVEAAPGQPGPEAAPAGKETVTVPAVQFVLPGTRRVFYRIIPGNTLSVIAEFFGVTISDLCTWNALDPAATIYPGMWIQIFVAEDRDLSDAVVLEEAAARVLVVGSEEFLDAMAAKDGKQRIKYEVQAGDTMKGVADEFGVTVSSIASINGIDYKATLEAGQVLVLYVKAGTVENAPEPEAAAAPEVGEPIPAAAPPAEEAPADAPQPE